MKVYIAGPMTGLPEFNYPAFFAAAEVLEERGYEPLNPATAPVCDSWEGYMRHGITQLMQADAVFLLDGYHNSQGARIESALAEKLSIPCYRSIAELTDAAGAAA